MSTCVFSLYCGSNHNCRYFDLQALGDLMMCILFYNEHQEHESQYKEKIHYTLLFVLNGLCIFDAHF